ncbi:MAG: biotin/lipoyl-binding protein [Anaerolineaceae bacterium]|nr:biotin/lipoyl-binding protein [Anaerolineaceae bacterium]
MNLSVTVDGKTFSVEIANPKADPMIITVDGTEFSVTADASGAVSAAPAASFVEGSETVTAPIPGVIQEVNVKPGQTVKKGDVLFVLEAMKMKNNITALQDGKVQTVNVGKGDSVAHGDVLMSYAVKQAAPAAAPAAKSSTAKAAAPAAGGDTVTAPIPGVIQEVKVQAGQSVKKGDVLFVLEAMKMKNNITAMHDGKVASVSVSKGDSVTHGQALMTYAA